MPFKNTRVLLRLKSSESWPTGVPRDISVYFKIFFYFLFYFQHKKLIRLEKLNKFEFDSSFYINLILFQVRENRDFRIDDFFI